MCLPYKQASGPNIADAGKIGAGESNKPPTVRMPPSKVWILPTILWHDVPVGSVMRTDIAPALVEDPNGVVSQRAVVPPWTAAMPSVKGREALLGRDRQLRI